MWAVLPINGNDGDFILGERGWLLIEEGIEFRMVHVNVIGGGVGEGWWSVGP